LLPFNEEIAPAPALKTSLRFMRHIISAPKNPVPRS
jgi:hypothetical protein